MMKNKLNWLKAVLVGMPFVVIAACWNRLPPRVPMHWNLRGEIDRWSPNKAAIFVMPLISLGAFALFHVLPRLDPRLRAGLQKGDRMHNVLQIFCVVLLSLFAMIFADQIATAFGYRIASGRTIISGILIMFVVMANYLGVL